MVLHISVELIQRRMHLIVMFLFLCLFIFSLFCPVGCLGNQVVEDIQNFSLKDKSSILSCLNRNELSQKDITFYKDYLEKYYPKVFVAREKFFTKMTPVQIADSLKDIVDIFTYDPWFYISDNKKRCNVGLYWEYILDQLSFFSEYIENAKVDKNKNIVFFTERKLFNFEDFDYLYSYKSLFAQENESEKVVPLKLFWQEKGIQVHHDFYALCFDYLVKLFNEGILYKDWSQASWYYYELRKVFDKLVGTKYEAEYHDHIKTFKELYDLLKIRLGLNREESSSDESEDKFWEEFMQYLEF